MMSKISTMGNTDDGQYYQRTILTMSNTRDQQPRLWAIPTMGNTDDGRYWRCAIPKMSNIPKISNIDEGSTFDGQYLQWAIPTIGNIQDQHL